MRTVVAVVAGLIAIAGCSGRDHSNDGRGSIHIVSPDGGAGVDSGSTGGNGGGGSGSDGGSVGGSGNGSAGGGVNLCDPEDFDDGFCECGCGVADPECYGAGCSEPGCRAPACQICYDGTDWRVCGWLCEDYLRSDGVCDCGCGANDPQCGGGACAYPNCCENNPNYYGCGRCWGF